MTVATQVNKVLYAGNGSQTVFPYPFKVFDASDVVVVRRAENGSEATLVPGAHYLVWGVGQEAGGSVTLEGPQAEEPPRAGERLLIKRVVPVIQNTDWVDNDPFPAAVIENAVDRLVCIAQQQEETLGRCLKVGETSSLSGLIDPDQLAADAATARDNAQASALSVAQAQAVLAQTQAVQVQTRADIAALRIGQPGGVASLDAAGQVIQEPANKGAPGGVASLNAAGQVMQEPAGKGQPGGVAGLDAAGRILATQAVGAVRDMLAGMIVEWEAAAIPTLADGLPLGLELDGAVAALAVYPRLERKWCGADANAAAPAWYKCNADGARNASGAYIRLQDRRGEFVRGFDHGRGVDAGRTLASPQAADNVSHAHTVDPPAANTGTVSSDHAHYASPPAGTTAGNGHHAHSVGNTIVGGGPIGGGFGVGTGNTGTSGDGNHEHWFRTPDFWTNGANANHYHSVDIPAFACGAQGSEGRPRNIAAMYLVLV